VILLDTSDWKAQPLIMRTPQHLRAGLDWMTDGRARIIAIVALSGFVAAAALLIIPNLGDAMGTFNALSGLSKSMPPIDVSGDAHRRQIIALIKNSFVLNSSSQGVVDAGYGGPDQLGNNGHTFMSGVVLGVVTGRSVNANFNHYDTRKGKRLSTKAGFERLLHLQLNESDARAKNQYCTRPPPGLQPLYF
jgi:hypothetical protein